MIRGTETAFRFKLPCSLDDLSWVKVKFWQHGYYGTEKRPLPIIKTKIDCCAYGTNAMIVKLTAEETARFSDTKKAYVQMTANNGATFGCKRKEITVYPIEDELFEFNDDYIVLDGGAVTDNETYTILDGKTV